MRNLRTLKRGFLLAVTSIWLSVTAATAHTQDSAPSVPDRSHPRQVFIDRDAEPDGRDRVLFVDLLTGETRSTLVAGERYTVLQNTVLYFDTAADDVMLIAPDLSVRPHPFIRKPTATRRVDWLVSQDAQRIAWTITEGTPNALITQTFVAELDGMNAQEAFYDGPRDSIRAFPVAFDVDRGVLYMDYQPDAIGDFTPLRQYAGLFAVNLTTREAETLPGEPGCFCGAGIGAGRLVRLLLADQFSGATGFNVRIVELVSGAEAVIATLNLDGFTQGGDVTIAPDGAQAVYTLAQVRGFGTPAQTVQTVFVAVDLLNGTQRQLTRPANSWFRPVVWTEDSRGLIVTSPALDGTWKIDLNDGSLRLIAEASYIGSLIPGAAMQNQ
ncbi:MAG: hypothetical protein SF162_17305 [bacterium]|nr:hypothetical protein [bacterium]